MLKGERGDGAPEEQTGGALRKTPPIRFGRSRERSSACPFGIARSVRVRPAIGGGFGVDVTPGTVDEQLSRTFASAAEALSYAGALSRAHGWPWSAEL